MSDSNTASDWPAWAQALLFFVVAFGGIQGVSAVLQGTITVPALVSAAIAGLTGAGIVYSYEWRRQAGTLDPDPASDSEDAPASDAPTAEEPAPETDAEPTSRRNPHSASET